MLDIITSASVNPVTALYGLLSVTYGTMALLANDDGHGPIARCYAASAIFYSLLGTCHYFHL